MLAALRVSLLLLTVAFLATCKGGVSADTFSNTIEQDWFDPSVEWTSIIDYLDSWSGRAG